MREYTRFRCFYSKLHVFVSYVNYVLQGQQIRPVNAKKILDYVSFRFGKPRIVLYGLDGNLHRVLHSHKISRVQHQNDYSHSEYGIIMFLILISEKVSFEISGIREVSIQIVHFN